MKASRYVVGIDLGTTNSAVAYADLGLGTEETPTIATLPIPQVVQPGVVEERPLLPSFLYLPQPSELPAGSLLLPWNDKLDWAAGEFARVFGSQVPTRLVSSAKSWLSHPGIDRRGKVLPWKAPDDTRRVSPVEASVAYLKHMTEAWNNRFGKTPGDHRLEQQDIVLTVPASFDAAARDLTVEAARDAGLEHLTLLEEPQAAFYSWIQSHDENWRKQVEPGDVILVCDVGGGTTDFTLIAVTDDDGNLALQRVAVGDHILLGGDNMDLALAHHAQQLFVKQGAKLDAGQLRQLWHACRNAKELLFSDPQTTTAPITVLGRGSKIIGNTLTSELHRAEAESVLVDGFFPECTPDVEPKAQRMTGLQELGLPYAADPAITKHLARFLRQHSELLAERAATRKGKKKAPFPTAVLFNGGVFKAGLLRNRLVSVLNKWSKSAGGNPVRVLDGTDLDLAVARGACGFGLVRRGKGIRIRGGTARAYYIGIESNLPSVPGMPPPLKALCVVPLGMEEGTETDVPNLELGLVVGEEAQFRFLGSSTRRGDRVGTVVEDWHDQIEELSPLITKLDSAGKEGKVVPVHLHSKVTPVGTLELSCHSRDSKERWRLEFNVREKEAEES